MEGMGIMETTGNNGSWREPQKKDIALDSNIPCNATI